MTSSPTCPGWASGRPNASGWSGVAARPRPSPAPGSSGTTAPEPYEFDGDEAAGTCTVTESWTDRRSGMQRTLGNRVVGERTEKNRDGIRQTLRALKRVAEAQHHRAH